MAPILLTIILLVAAFHSSTAGIQKHRGSSHDSLRDVSGLSRTLEADRPRNSANNDEDADFIIGDAKQLSKYQHRTFPLSIHSSTAFPIVTAFFPDTKQTHPMLAGGRLGKGKVIGGTDKTFFKVGEPKYKEDEMVLLNALRWLSKDSAPKKVGYIKYDRALVTFLRANGIEAGLFYLAKLSSVSLLEAYDVLFLPFSNVNEIQNLEVVSEFIRNGGGALILGCSNYMIVDKPFAENHLLNKLTAPAGFVWTQQWTEGQPEKSDYYTLSKGTPSKTKTALDAVRILGDRKCSLDDPEIALLSYIYTATPAGTPLYPGTEFEQLVQKLALDGHPVPSEANRTPATPDYVCSTKRFHKIMDTWLLKHPEIVMAHPAAKNYPGVAVTARMSHNLVEYHNISVEPLKNFEEYTDVNLNIDNCMYGLNGTSTKESQVTKKNANYWLSTGRYLNAGANGQITILNRSDKFDKLEVLVGAHTDTLHRDSVTKWSRLPDITITYNFYDGVAKFSSPYGGLVYIKVPYFLARDDLDVSTLQLSFQGDLIKAPVFDSDIMDNEAWKAERNNPAPWAEIGNNRVKFIVPSSKVRTLDDAVGLMKLWNEAMDAFSDLLGLPKVFYRPQRILEDIQVAYGYMHAGYPIMIPTEKGTDALSVKDMKTRRGSSGGAPCWGHYHELGHNFQDKDIWSPAGAGSDVTNNIMTVYVCQHVSGVAPEDAHEHNTFEVYKNDVGTYIKNGKKNWPADAWSALQFYMYLQRTYGWGFYKKFFESYAQNKYEKPEGNVGIMSLSLEVMSTAAGKNLVDYFDSWNIEVSKEAREKVSKMELPMSGLKIEDILSK